MIFKTIQSYVLDTKYFFPLRQWYFEYIRWLLINVGEQHKLLRKPCDTLVMVTQGCLLALPESIAETNKSTTDIDDLISPLIDSPCFGISQFLSDIEFSGDILQNIFRIFKSKFNQTFRIAVDWEMQTSPSFIHGRFGNAKFFWISGVALTLVHSERSQLPSSFWWAS